ncbi:MAG: serine hydrolase [Litoreibacter sp.]
MKRFFKWMGWIFAVIALVAIVVGIWQREQITRLMAVNSLFSEEKIVANFSNMKKAFLFTEITNSAVPSPLPLSTTMSLPVEYDNWVETRSVTSALVLHEGKIVHEAYYQGTKQDDLRISWSVSKSFLSALFGIVLEEGSIGSIDDLVTKYVPELTGSAYEGVSIKNVLQMSTGVTFDEDYLDYNSDINRMGRVLALGGTMDEFAAGLTETNATPGEKWKYVSIDTHVLGMVIRGATGRSIADLMGEKLIKPLGFEVAPYYLTDGVGVAFVLGGLNVTTRDYARLGQMFQQDGMWQGNQIVPRDWIRASTLPSANTQPGDYGYGYQWWSPKDAAEGEFLARGIYGQYIYIDRTKNIVIVATSADRNFRAAGTDDQNIDLFRSIVANLD